MNMNRLTELTNEDFERTFTLNRLYNDLYQERFPYRFEDLSEQQIRDFVPVTKGELSNFLIIAKEAIDGETMFEVLVTRYGLRGGGFKTYEQIGEIFGFHRTRAGQVLHHALMRLRRAAITMKLPPIIDSDDKNTERRDELINKITELRRLTQEAESELQSIAKTPFRVAAAARKCLNGEDNQVYLSDYIHDSRLVTALRIRGIDTLQDVIDLPKEKWKKKYLGIDSRRIHKLEEAIHSMGFEDFRIIS